ncbi:MAG: hypothetical protein RH942_16425 [Kiloniellaceae bacterium]
MIKPIEYDDVFGYDDSGKPCAVQLHGNVYGFGYAFCGALKPLLDRGCLATHRLFDDGAAFIFVFDPKASETELWKGQWAEDEGKIYSIVDPARVGLLSKSPESFDALKDFAKSDMSALGLQPSSLSKR